MLERKLMGTTNKEVAKLGLGCMRFPKKEDGSIDQEQVNKMIDYAYEHGVNYYDTAPVYGDGTSETALGIAINKYPRDSYYLATKCPIWNLKELSDVERILDECLARLKTDYVDFFLLHALNAERVKTIKEMKIYEECLRLKSIGKIRHIGFSIHAPYEVLLELVDSFEFEFAQIQYNYLDEDSDPGLKGYEELKKRNIPMVIMEPVKGGTIANLPEVVGAPLRKLSDKSFASYGYRWVADCEGVNVILAGVSSFEQIKDNVQTFEENKRLTNEEKDAIEEVKNTILSRQKVGCTQCSYCMPCPFGVNIPRCFAIWNNKAMYSDFANERLRDLPVEDLEKCQACGVCLSKCPQSIQIPEKLAQMLEEAKK